MSEKSSEVNIDEKKLNQMKLGIILVERKNLKTREKSNDEMVETIRKIIENEIKKNY
ncbi:hypothetical protein ACWF7H_19220 [Peribacillus butanolivorans]|uniref:hypothetical protein n=1 Tax=Peribacillus butanolivorans TaxID=421767 RepID=UPI0036C014A1